MSTSSTPHLWGCTVHGHGRPAFISERLLLSFSFVNGTCWDDSRGQDCARTFVEQNIIVYYSAVMRSKNRIAYFRDRWPLSVNRLFELQIQINICRPTPGAEDHMLIFLYFDRQSGASSIACGLLWACGVAVSIWMLDDPLSFVGIWSLLCASELAAVHVRLGKAKIKSK